MSSLDYSPEAINVLNLFYRSEVILYVEGEDDVPFWDVVFKKFSESDVKVVPVFGAPEVDKKISEIVINDLNVLAARDSDYLRVSGQHVSDARVLYTYGYSIENCLYSPGALAAILAMWRRSQNLGSEDCKVWFDSVFESLNTIMLCDVANFIFQRGVSVLPDSCGRFMKDNNSIEVDAEKLQSYLGRIKRHFSAEELAESADILDRHGYDLCDIVRGHFLASLAHRFVSKSHAGLDRKRNISFDALYSNALLCFKGVLKEDRLEYYQSSVANALGAVLVN